MVVGFCLGVGLSFSRLLGVQGVESALVLGLVLPPLCAAIGARTVIAARLAGEFPTAGAVLRRATMSAILVWLIPVTVLAVNQIRVRNCTPFEGLAFVALGPGVGVLVAALVGVFFGAWVRRPRRATLLAVLVPLLSYGFGLWAFWSTPAIFVYDHFVGWFPGSLYDEDISLPMTFVTFRLVTLGLALTVAFAIVAMWRPGLDRLGAPRGLAFPLALVMGAATLLASSQGDALGHRGRTEAIQEALGWRGEGERCVVFGPRELSPESKRRLVLDCDFRVANAARVLGVDQDEKVHAYFYRSVDEKRRWMGAGRTFIAKPWRREVHLQLRAWPHPVLAHEIVHVVAGRAAEGPFQVSGSMGGWRPNPGLIEGVAVAIEWPERDGMDPDQFCRAMRQLDMLPRLSDVMSLRFLTLPTRRAYAAAGSFVHWMFEAYGAEEVRRVHRAGVLDALGSTAELEAAWHAHLDDVELPEGALALTELRFYRASIFQTACPHRLARLHQEMAFDRAAGDERRLALGCTEALEIDPGDIGARAALVGAAARFGAFEAADRELDALEGAPPPLIARAREELADARWLRGDRDVARAVYAELLELPQSDDEARAREVKLDVLRAGGAQGRFVRDLLVGHRGRSPNATVAMHLAREIDRVREDGLGAYLEGRQLLQSERFDLALPALQRAETRGLPTDRLQDERLRLEAMAHFAVGDLDAAEQTWERAESRARLRHEASDWLLRIAHTRGL